MAKRREVVWTKNSEIQLQEILEFFTLRNKSNEYSSKSELVNDLIRQARKQQMQVDWIRAKLDKAEISGFTNDTKEQILKLSKSKLDG